MLLRKLENTGLFFPTLLWRGVVCDGGEIVSML